MPYVAVGRGETNLFENPWFMVNTNIPQLVSSSMPISHDYTVTLTQGTLTMTLDGSGGDVWKCDAAADSVFVCDGVHGRIVGDDGDQQCVGDGDAAAELIVIEIGCGIALRKRSAEFSTKDFGDGENHDANNFDFCGAAVGGGLASPAMAQEGISGDAAVTYRWVHTNAAPGDCGCFGLNGGGVSASWNVRGPWSVVADFGSGVAKGAPTVGSSLTLTSGMGGARFELPRLRRNWIHGAHRVQPFAQILVGVAHAGGGAAGIADGTNRFAARAGGGFDVPVSRHFSVRGAGGLFSDDVCEWDERSPEQFAD